MKFHDKGHLPTVGNNFSPDLYLGISKQFKIDFAIISDEVSCENLLYIHHVKIQFQLVIRL